MFRAIIFASLIVAICCELPWQYSAFDRRRYGDYPIAIDFATSVYEEGENNRKVDFYWSSETDFFSQVLIEYQYDVSIFFRIKSI